MSLAAAHLRSAPESTFLLSDQFEVGRGRLAALMDEIRKQIRAYRLPSVVTYIADAGNLVAALAACEEEEVPIVLVHRTLPEDDLRALCRTLGAPGFLDDALDWVFVSDPRRLEKAAFTVTLMTSGTTGRPKLVRHSMPSLLGRIAGPAALAMNREKRWLLTYQPTAFAGLQVILTALCTGGAVVQTASRRPADFFLAAEQFGVTHISGTPTFWRSFLLAAPPGSLPGLQQITLGGEAIDQPTLDRLANRFPNARITHIYASSEAGALFAVHDGRAGFPSEWLRPEADGVGLRIREGVLEVHSPRRMLGYLDESVPSLTDDGWLVTGDLATVNGDRVHFQGRLDDVLNVGGAKVYPKEIEEFFLSCRGVQEVRVRGVRNPISGVILAADVVLEDGYEPDSYRLELMRQCQIGLPAHKAPRLIRVVPEIVVLDSGKKA
jgi:acyl-coenzyme A synthetase/AMP-(fatty) acid ligase